MLDLQDPGAVLVAHRGWIEKVAQITCRRNSVWGAEAEDFASLAFKKLIENDYAVLRRFRGECELKTYLTAVVVRRFQEYAREAWGRWRYSARAEQLGHPAKDLEALVYREGSTLAEAIQVLRGSGRTELDSTALTRIFAQLPERRGRPQEVGAAALDTLPASTCADDRVIRGEAESRCRPVIEALTRALSALDPDDQTLVRGRFGEGRSVADIARALRCEQAPLYRRSDQLLSRVRQTMEQAGVRREDVAECLSLSEY